MLAVTLVGAGECKYTIGEPDGHTEWVSCVRFSPVTQVRALGAGGSGWTGARCGDGQRGGGRACAPRWSLPCAQPQTLTSNPDLKP